MSKFIDKLMRLRQTEPQPMGFALGRPAVEKPRMQLAVSLTSDNSDSVAAISDSVDAVIIELAKANALKAIEKICQAKESPIAGGWFRISEDETLSKLSETTCDFIVFPTNSTLAVTQKEKIGKILELDETLSDALLRTINDLPVDAVLVSDKEKEKPLTLNRLMAIRRIIQMLNKPVIASVSDSLTSSDLQAIWDLGVSCLLIESVNDQSAAKLKELKKAIEKLAPAASRKKERASPLLPRIQAKTPPTETEHPDEEEEEDE